MKLVFRPRARADLEDIFEYLQQRSPSGLTNVMAAIHAATRVIGEQPQGSQRTDHPEIRVKVELRYRYKIFYRVLDDSVEILHIRHASRRPWI